MAIMAVVHGQLAAKLLVAIFAIIMGVGGYFVMKLLIFDVVDEVWDCGDSILVKNNGREFRFTMPEFRNMSYSPMRPPRITLPLRSPSEEFGTDIAFVPPIRMFPYSVPPIARDLMERIDEARRQLVH